MKIYILYSDPFDDGAVVYGLFSSEEKVENAINIFKNKSNYELFYMELELDGLEKHFDRALLPERMYSGYKMSYAEWKFTPCGLDSFIENRREENVSDWGNHMYASIIATSEQEAIEKAKKMIEEGKVWKWEKEKP